MSGVLPRRVREIVLERYSSPAVRYRAGAMHGRRDQTESRAPQDLVRRRIFILILISRKILRHNSFLWLA